MLRKNFLLRMALLLPLVTTTAGAADFPMRAVSIVVPYAPGGSTDVLARIVAKGMSANLGQAVVVENQGGAGGALGTQRVVRAPADGYVLSFGNMGSLAANVPLYPNLGYDPRRDLAPIGLAATNPMVLAVSVQSGQRDMAGFRRILRDKGDRATFGTAGTGSTSHLAAALFVHLTTSRATLVGYRGAGPAITDLAAGTVDAVIDQTLTLIPAHKGGTAAALAVASRTRIPQLPDVPTFAEAGLPAFDVAVWNALMAPANTPPAVVERLAASLSDALDDREVHARLEELAALVPGADERGPAPLRGLIAAEISRWSDVIRTAGIRAD